MNVCLHYQQIWHSENMTLKRKNLPLFSSPHVVPNHNFFLHIMQNVKVDGPAVVTIHFNCIQFNLVVAHFWTLFQNSLKIEKRKEKTKQCLTTLSKQAKGNSGRNSLLSFRIWGRPLGETKTEVALTKKMFCHFLFTSVHILGTLPHNSICWDLCPIRIWTTNKNKRKCNII